MVWSHQKRSGVIAIAVVISCAICIAPDLRAQNPSMTLIANQQPEGVLEPWKSSNVACADNGLLESVLVKPGDRVKSGDILAQLDMTLVEVQLDIARSQANSIGKIEQVQAEAELAEKKVRSIQNARENNHSTQSELDRALAELKIVNGRLHAEQDERNILQLQATRMEKLIGQRRIIAPIDGVVQKVHKSVGEYVSPNSPEVVRIVDVSKLRASFFLQLHEISTLKVGSKTKVAISGGDLKPAIVEYIAPFPDGSSGMIEVQVLIDNPELKIFGSRCNLMLERSTDLVSGR